MKSLVVFFSTVHYPYLSLASPSLLIVLSFCPCRREVEVLTESLGSDIIAATQVIAQPLFVSELYKGSHQNAE